MRRTGSGRMSTLPASGAWCRTCEGTEWWTERHAPYTKAVRSVLPDGLVLIVISPKGSCSARS